MRRLGTGKPSFWFQFRCFNEICGLNHISESLETRGKKAISWSISLFFHRIKELFESYLEFLLMSTMSTLVCHCIGRHSWFMFIKLLIAVEATNKQRPKSAHSAALVLSGTVYVFNWSLSSSSSQKGAQKTFGKMHRLSSAPPSELVEPRANGARAVAGWNT